MIPPLWAVLVALSEPRCAICGGWLDYDAAFVTYRNDEAGKAHDFQFVHRDIACREYSTSVGAFVNRCSMSLNDFLFADAAGVWLDRIARGKVHDPDTLRAFVLHSRQFRYSTLS